MYDSKEQTAPRSDAPSTGSQEPTTREMLAPKTITGARLAPETITGGRVPQEIAGMAQRVPVSWINKDYGDLLRVSFVVNRDDFLNYANGENAPISEIMKRETGLSISEVTAIPLPIMRDL